MKKGLCLLVIFSIVLSVLFVGCDSNKTDEEKDDVNFPDLTAEDEFGDEPYHLYFQSHGDGTCSLDGITMNPKNPQEFVLVIPERSPSGDLVTAISESFINAKTIAMKHQIPYVIPTSDFEMICAKLKESDLSEFDYSKLIAYYPNLSEAMNERHADQLKAAYPICEYEDVHVLDPMASAMEIERISWYWRSGYEGYESLLGQFNAAILEMAKRCETREMAELYLSTICYYQNFDLITGIVIPDAITDVNNLLGFGMFSNLTSVKIGNGVSSIPYDAFEGCDKLSIVEWGESVKSIDKDAFRGCTGLTSITIPDGVTSIGDYAFYGCTGLTNIVIPDGVTSIGDYAFYGCTGLTNIVIPDSVTSIGYAAFEDCAFLKSVTLPDHAIESFSSEFANCDAITDIVISGTSIGNDKYAKCTNLKSVIILNGVTEIGASAFYACSNLTNISIPDSVTFIGASAFAYCNGLTNVTISNGVKRIYAYAFTGCTSLQSVTIPKSVTSISAHAFAKCTALTDVYFAGTEEEWAAIGFGEDNDALSTATIHYNYVPEE